MAFALRRVRKGHYGYVAWGSFAVRFQKAWEDRKVMLREEAAEGFDEMRWQYLGKMHRVYVEVAE